MSESGDLRSVSPDIKQSGKYKNMIKKCGGDYPINQRRKWRLEELRGNTRVDMKEITKQLCKVRGDELGRPKVYIYIYIYIYMNRRKSLRGQLPKHQ